MALRSVFVKKNSLCTICRCVLMQKYSYSDKVEQNYSEEQKHKILEVINEPDTRSLSRYDITKARIKYITQWKNSNGNLKCLSDIDMIESFSDKHAVKLFDSILNGPLETEKDGNKASKKIKGTILHPLLSDNIRQKCETVVAVYISVNSICWTLISRNNYEVLQWEYYGIDYPDNKKFHITDIMNIAWHVTRRLPLADIYVMKAEATTLRAAGSDPNNPKVLAVNLQKAQMISMIVALINARSNNLSDNDESETEEPFNNRVYFLRPTLPYRLYGTLVGNEKVSTDQAVEMILQKIGVKSNDNTQVYVSEPLKSYFRNQKDLQKDMLGHCLLLAMTFMDICIYKRNDSIEKLIKRGE